MNYPIGIEMSKDYLSYETAKAAYKLVKDVMLAKEGENIVITADSSSDRRVVEATANAAYSVGAIPVVIYCPTSENAYAEPVPPIGQAVSHADVWIEFAYSSIMLCSSYQKALDFGCRYINLTGMDVTMMVNTIGKVDYKLVVELGELIKGKLEKADEVIIRDKNGTDLKAYNRGRAIRHSGQIATNKGYPYMLGGQISWCPVEETINGTLVFDVALFPPTELGLLNSNIVLTFENGRVVNIDGGKDAAVFRAWLENFEDENMYRLAHYSLGFNPGVTKATGRIVEDERIFGCMEFGIGSQGSQIKGAFWTAASHTDGVVSKPSIILDGKPLEINGKYVDPEVAALCKKLNINGY
ncbi:Leucyl aminopeptidase (aminopeptidase T) [Dethiosulfatibacter aminovorans DSM 17477]|uniref:Leucyl aminopeptidase (Aminopeptidase T) n=1 Tax=Dethiosulfatibacter aminovorans DSM 17477 TaxID=1121476 RepID=A0A1M6BMS9_9FIRM|nr:aminopeptidase [Dethiosulfatibacter aminovorans]SHI49967.1 Leucyl aminopeptidase (aminopeptidase T) [Dethiosulfatibacter aminovorans DSM 17477]